MEARQEFAGAETHSIMIIIRWLVVSGLIAYGWRRKSLTTWILVAMVAGAEIGNDWPGIAVNLRLLSLIFLNLIRTIIAPLLFATLVVGIAGHPNLRQVGRMGIKALVYFEVVTTLALLIGLAAINISNASNTASPERIRHHPSHISGKYCQVRC
jgi:proton glutamate symport protein